MVNEIIAVTPSNVYDLTKLNFLLESAEKNGFDPVIIGLNKPFVFISKIIWLKEYLESLPISENPIISFTDAYDVFYGDSLETIKNKFLAYNTDILWSVEKWYSHQLNADKAFYDTLENPTNSSYKYINTGTFIGYKNSLLDLFNDIYISIINESFMGELAKEGWALQSSAVDQTIISHHFVKFWYKYKIKLDYDCGIFYLPCGDWDDIEKHMMKDFTVVETRKKPSIVHVPWRARYENILIQLFHWKFYNKMEEAIKNKRYSWRDLSIIFLENGQMYAFGEGMYVPLDTHILRAEFGSKIHTIIFNNDYTEFVSIRTIDQQIVKGRVL
jgi:hypothetical protein